MTSRLSLLVKTSRPLGWPIIPLAFLMGLWYSGSSLGHFQFFQLLFLSFPFSIFLYGVNDVYDYESDKLNPRKKLIEGIKLEPKHHQFVKDAALVMAVVLVISSLLTLNHLNIFGTLLLLFFSYSYSAPPLRLKERAPLDSLSNGVIYVIAPALMGFSFGGTLDFPLKAYFVATCAVGVHSFGSVMDYTVDKKVGDKTFAVVFGRRAASMFAFLIFISTFLFAAIETPFIVMYLVFCTTLFFITTIHPSEKLASLFFKLILFGFLATAAAFIIYVLYL